MAPRRLTTSDLLFRLLLATAGVAALVAGAAVAMRPRGKTNASPGALHPAQPIADRASGDVILLGWARTIGGRRGKYRSGPYAHEVELEDGRKVRYVSDKPFGGGQCVKVRARVSAETIVVLHLEPSDEPCPERDRFKR